jgi:hypothetical protein
VWDGANFKKVVSFYLLLLRKVHGLESIRNSNVGVI